MDKMKSMIFGAKPKAVKWLGMGPGSSHGDDEDHRGNDRMFVHPEAATQVLLPLGDQPINLISIFGAARQGKSFLMNLLADQQDLFKISNLREPCTQGVDLSGHFLPLPKFSGLNGCPAISSNQSEKEALQIGFVDAEGQGDRDITYDSRLVSPVLLSSKVVIFNWKDSLQGDRILNLLAVLARAAQGIELADGDNSKVFGHLHIIFRDWSFVDSSPDEVFKDLFTKEKGRSEEVNIRNLARVNLLEAFESINVWLFPAPVANTANLKDKIRFEQLQAPFQEKLRELRKMLSSQLQHPMHFGGKPLTARLLSQMMPALVNTLNSDQVIMPESIYSSLVRAEAKATKDECEKSIAAYCEAAALEEVVSTAELESALAQDIDFLITEAIEKMKGTPASLQKEMRDGLEAYAAKEIRLIIKANNEKIAEKLSEEVDVVFANLREECALIEREAIPMRSDLLRRRCADMLASEINRLEVLPLGAHGKKGLDVEINRVRQHASVQFDKLEVANEKAIQKAGSAINEMVRNGKTRLTRDMHETLDKIFQERTPIKVVILQSGLNDQFLDLTKEIKAHVDENPYLSVEFMDDLNHHKNHLAEELNRRYYSEIRQILLEVELRAKDDLGKAIGLRLEDKLPLAEDDLKRSIDEAVKEVKAAASNQMRGWTILSADIEDKSKKIEKLGDVYVYDYLRRNKTLQQDISARQVYQQYDDLKAEVVDEFQRVFKSIQLPVPDAQIDAVFVSTLKEMITEFMALETTNKEAFSASKLYERLSADCKPDLENQKILNRLASEKKEALELAEKEKRLREQDNVAARQKEHQITELKTYVQKSLGERDEETKRLQEKLRTEAERAQQLAQEVEEMRRQTREAELQKAEIEMHAREQALREEIARRQESEELKQQLEELRLQAAELEAERYHQASVMEAERQRQTALAEARQQQESLTLAQNYEAMRRRAAELEAEKYALERLNREESQRREQAEQAARAAAQAAALSARAAIEAAADETDLPDSFVDTTRGHHLAAARAAQAQHRASPPTASDAKKRKVNHTPPKAAAVAEKPKSSGLSVLEEARLAAKAEMERRIQERTKTLKEGGKKKK